MNKLKDLTVDIHEYWDNTWIKEPEWKAGFGIEPERFIPFTSKIGNGARVLDIGGGRGEILNWLRTSRQLQFTGEVFDASPRAAEIATARGFIGHHGSCYDLPFEAHTFDNVLAGNLLTHLEEPQIAVAMMRWVCKRGGWVSISVGVKHVKNHDSNVTEIEEGDLRAWLPGCELQYIGDRVHLVCHWRKP